MAKLLAEAVTRRVNLTSMVCVSARCLADGGEAHIDRELVPLPA